MLVSLAINIVAVVVICLAIFYGFWIACAIVVFIAQGIGNAFCQMFNIRRRY